MTTYELLSYLQSLNVVLWRDGEQLRFSAPSGVITPALREEIRKHKAELLASLLALSAPRPLPPEQSNMPLPLSFAQQRLWFLHQLEPANPVYNEVFAVRLRGPLHAAILEQSINAIVARHENLRTIFATVQDQPVQHIMPALSIPLFLTDLLDISPAEKEVQVQDIIRAEALSAFDLSKGPLLRTSLFCLGEQEHILLVVAHHIVGDNWSVRILLKDLSEFYTAFEQKRPAHLPPLPIQYADFAAWQRQWLQGPILDQQLAYWKERLAGAPTLLELPTDHPRPEVQTHRGAHIRQQLPSQLTAQLKALTQREQSTLFMALLAAFAALLARYSGQGDLVVGTPIANRMRKELEGLIGFFVNMLAIRVDLVGSPSFFQLLRQVRTRAREAYAHQDIPFERLVEDLQLPRTLSYAPIVQVLLVLQEENIQPASLSNVSVEMLDVEIEVAKFDLTLTVRPLADTLVCSWEYNTQLFEQDTIVRLGQHFQVLLEGIVAHPEQSIATLPLLTASEQQQILRDWNATEVAYHDGCAHELFEAQARQTPDAIAMVFEQEQLSYAELNRRTNQLAHHLRGCGVGPEIAVGVCMERSVEMVIGLMSVLKAGGAYVPLEPDHPTERLRFLLEDTKGALVLTQERLSGRLAHLSVPLICLDSEQAQWSSLPQSDPLPLAEPKNLAYIIYTSGSTGTPKGVLVTHDSLGNMVQALVQIFAVTAHSHVLQFASPGFDASLVEIVYTLSTGAGLYLAHRERLLPGQELLHLLREYAITVLTVPPSALTVMEPVPGLNLETLVVTGEACPQDVVMRWAGGRRFCNAYGPTEVTVGVSIAQGLGVGREGEKPGIGRPVANKQIYLLDRQDQPVPIGVPGEVHVGGVGLARGYLNRPDLTAEKFIPHPFSQQEGARLYKTGDLACYQADGTLQFLGRLDQQIKLRGQRLEPGEIEIFLRQHPAVQASLVMAREDTPGDMRLVAYVVPRLDATPTDGDLRRYLQDKLPEYMVPGHFVLLDALPLTSSGKIDWKQLPAVHEERQEESEIQEMPLTMLEEVVLGVWSDGLTRKRIGRHQNFFELGGHSLLAAQVISRLQTSTRVDIRVKDIFEHPTIAQLAARIEQLMRRDEGLPIAQIEPLPRQEELPLSFAQQRLWFIEQLEPGTALYLIPVFLRLRGYLQIEALSHGLRSVIQRHESLRTIFPSRQGVPRQVIVSQLAWQLPLIDLSELAEPARLSEMDRMLRQASTQPFDLEHGPLFRAALLRLQPDDHMLVCTLHHIVADGWSARIFFNELTEFYKAFQEGRPTHLPPLPIQYADFAAWQRQWLQGAVLEEQIAYWRDRLDGAPALLELPTDHPRPQRQTYHGFHIRQLLPERLTTQVRALNQREQSTLFMTLLAAFAILLARSSGQDDIVIGAAIANRTRSEIEGLIGFFVNTLAIRLDLTGSPAFSQLLRQVRARALEAYAHQDIPFERLVEDLQPQRTPSYAPIVQVLLDVEEGAMQTASFPKMNVEILGVDVEVAKFDVTLLVRPQADTLVCQWEYNTALFEHETIVRLGQHFQVLLEGIVAHPEQSIRTFPLLTANEQQQILRDWNASEVVYPTDGCVHELFEAQASQTPDAIAVVFEQEQLSYAELNRRANQLAHHLRGMGVGTESALIRPGNDSTASSYAQPGRKESLVGICLHRSIEMLVATLAILKAGGTYVPLDPSYPQARLAFMLNDANIVVVVTHSSCLSSLPPSHCNCLRLDSSWPEIAQEPQHNLSAALSPEALAYIIYTSGTSGNPKGAMITHGGLTNYLLWCRSRYHLPPGASSAVHSSLAFDLTVTGLYVPLLLGGRVTLLPEGQGIDALAQAVCQQQFSLLKMTPTHFTLLNQALTNEQMGQVRGTVVLGGEALLAADLERWLRYAPQAHIINEYGPTETVVGSCNYEVTLANRGTGIVPIGGPIGKTLLYVLDASLQPVPVGVVGELCIGGEIIARGYLGQAELTAERFVPDPFVGKAGARMYRSGDLVRYRSDGVLDILGRQDEQVKLRGYRIELGEIEAALGQHPAVKTCVVMMREDTPGDKRLVAYVITRLDISPEQRVAPLNASATGSELRRYLLEKLPEYMVPSAFVLLGSLPLTSRGKLDRAALPAPAQWIRDEQASEFVAPHTQLEKMLAAIWSQVLDIDRISIHDNFFATGGDSIRSIQVLALMKERALSCSLQDIFQYQTIYDLANMLQATQADPVVRPQTEPFSLLSAEDKALLPADIEDAYPLTALQAGMIYHLFLTTDDPMYHNVLSLHLRRTLDENAFQQALQLLVARHANLRTSFDLGTYSKPLQLVHKTAFLPLKVEDLRSLSKDEQEDIINAFVKQEKTHLFDIASPPLLRVHIFQRTEETFQLTITEAHTILDGWSYHLNFVEIFQYHDQILRGDVPDPQPLKLSFRDYVALEQQVLQSDKHRSYWIQKLSNTTFVPIPHLQSPEHRPVTSHVPGRSVPLSPQLSEELWQLSRLSGFPLKSVMLAAHTRLMALLSDTFDVVTGFIINGRLEEADGEQVRGVFLQTIPFRLTISQGTWLDLIREVFKTEQELLPFRRYPLSAIQDDLGGQTLFETAFNYMHFHSITDIQKTLEVVDPEKALEDTNFTLLTDVFLDPSSSRISLNLRYDMRLISEEQFAAISHYYENILKSMVSNPHAPHHQQCFLSPEEMQKSLFDWNRTETGFPVHSLLHTTFEAQVAKTPDAVALVYEQEALTYEEVNARANQLAHYLRKRGIGPEVLVGICLHPGLEMLVGLLGILKAGGAYIPLNPAYPAERQELMLADADAPLLLTQQALLSQVSTKAVPVLCLDADWPLLAGEQKGNPSITMSAEHLAYLIYTSGSTGVPKGVMVSHANVLRLFAASQGCFQFDQRDVWTLFHSFAFDFSIWEIWGALLYGGRLVVVPYAVSRSPETFAELLATQSVTVLNQTPSAFRQLVLLEKERAWVKALALRWIIFGGEALDAPSIKIWFERYGEFAPQLVNMYGITETTVHVTFSPLHPTDIEYTTGTMIGRPLADLQVYVLDEYQQPAPIGVAGEMYVGGAGLARGYLNRPQLTSERFVAHPFSTQPGARLYRTGDRARFWPDGRLEYLGRNDRQVKIRGFRIELGEIEAQLESLPQVKIGVVIAREDIPGEKRLVAYVVAREGIPFTSGELRRALLERLPEYMLPMAFVQLEALPLTTQGKLDRRALPAPDQSRPSLEETYVPPQTSTEEILAMVWASALSIDRVGIHDNFFALGGDSIRSIRVLAQARQRGLLFTLQQLFQAQTIFRLARMLVAAEQNHFPLDDRRPGSLLKPADWHKCPADVEDAYPLSKLQAGMIFHSQYNTDFALYQDIMTYHLRMPLKLEYLQEGLRYLVARHAILRTSLDLEHFSEPLQLVHRSAVIPLQVTDLREYSQEDQERLLADWIERQVHQAFDCTQAPLLRLFIHIRSDHSFQFTLNCHHAILDGWSVASLLTEFFTHYFTLLEGRTLLVEEPLKAHYRDFIAREQSLLNSEEARLYWARVLEGNTHLTLPQWARSGWKKERATFYELEVPITRELSDRLNQLARTLAVPLKSVLLAVHLKVLSVLYGQSDVLTGLVSNGRPEIPDGERVLGLFLNTPPFRMGLYGKTWISLINDVFAAECETLPYRWYPLAEIQKQQGGQDLFETAFSFTHFHVYSALIHAKNFHMISAGGVARTNFALDVRFSQDIFSSRIILVLACNFEEVYPEQVEMIAGYYSSALKDVADEPYKRHDQRSLLSAKELQQALVEWNKVYVEYSKESYLHELIEAQVKRTPGAVAVVYENEHVTYEQLNERANQLAHHLRGLGVGTESAFIRPGNDSTASSYAQPGRKESLVGICLPRSIEMLVATLAILKAGGAYVPLDPSYPQARLAFMLHDANVGVLLTQSSCLSLLPPFKSRIVCLDTAWPDIAQEPQHNLSSTLWPEALAYIIYTSGTSGHPKGAMITHQGLTNYVLWCRSRYHLPPEASSAVHSSLAFDLTVTGLYVPLLLGGRVTLLPEGQGIDALAHAIRHEQFSLLKMTPTYFNLLAQALTNEQMGQVRGTVVLGGEALLAADLERWLHHAPQARIINEYGPTETVVGSCNYEVTLANRGTGIVPIGEPIGNTWLYVLDASLQPVPVGVVGELYIGGEIIARGYLGQAGLTAERFMPDPFVGKAGARMYRSGDLVRYRSDGVLDVLGRQDEQVKLRGYRIELGEIEATLNDHPELYESAVILTEDHQGDKLLVAYVVKKDQGVLLPRSELRQWLREKLPEYMIPTYFVELESLPLTDNGKVDRQALPASWDLTEPQDREYAPPRTHMEKVLVAIWSEVLGHAQVSIHNNFFEELGGDSLDVLRVVNKIQQADLTCKPAWLFQYQTIADLASVIVQNNATYEIVSGDVPLFPMHRWLFENLPALDKRWLGEKWILVMYVEVDIPLDLAIFEQAMHYVISYHDSLRARFIPTPDGWTQTILDPAELAPFRIERFDLSALPAPEQHTAIENVIDHQRAKMDITHGPVIHATYMDLGPGKPGRLLVLTHHLIADDVSSEIIVQDTLMAYAQLTRGEQVHVPVKTATIQQWMERLIAYAQTYPLGPELDYWQGLPWKQVGTLPVDFPENRFRMEATLELPQNVWMSQEETDALFRLVCDTYHAQFIEILEVALGRAFARWTGSHVFLFTRNLHGRDILFDDIDVSRTVGWFARLSPTLLQLSAEASYTDAIRSVQDQLRQTPQDGAGAYILRYLHPDPEVRNIFSAFLQSEIFLNYAPRPRESNDQATHLPTFRPAPENAYGWGKIKLRKNDFLITIMPTVENHCLRIQWIFASNLFRQKSMDQVMSWFKEELLAMIASCPQGSEEDITYM